MKRALVLLGWALAASPAWAGGTGGASPLNFLFLDADARPVAMGGAYAALAADANALLYNPAGLAFLDSHQAVFMHTEHFQGVSQEYAAMALHGSGAVLSTGAGMGFMVNTVGYGEIKRTTLSNPRGTNLGSFGIRDWALAAGYGKRLEWDWIAVGASIKYLREEIDQYSAQAGAVDLGMLVQLKQPLGVPASFGLALQNMGTKLRYQSSREELPLNLRMGASYRFLDSGVLALDVNQPRDGEMTLHLGVEYAALKAVALRLGYNGRNDADSGITVGGGLSLSRFGFNYAFVPFGDLGASHRFSIAYRW